MVGTIVQTASSTAVAAGGQIAFTFPGSPANGNWMICLFSHWQNSPSSATGWLQALNQNGPIQDGVAIFYKKAGVAEPAAQAVAIAINDGFIAAWEVAGLSGTWATDFQQGQSNVDQPAAPVLTTNSFNTSAANTMILGLCCGVISSPGTEAVPTVATGQTNDNGITENAGTHRNGSAQSFHQFFATNGSAVQYTSTWGVNQLEGFWVIAAMNWTSLGPAPLALTGRTSFQMKCRASIGAPLHLFARSSFQMKAKSAVALLLQLKARTKFQVKARLLLGVSLHLIGRTSFQVKMRGYGTQALFARTQFQMKARARFSTFRGYAVTVRNIVGNIWPDEQ